MDQSYQWGHCAPIYCIIPLLGIKSKCVGLQYSIVSIDHLWYSDFHGKDLAISCFTQACKLFPELCVPSTGIILF